MPSRIKSSPLDWSHPRSIQLSPGSPLDSSPYSLIKLTKLYVVDLSLDNSLNFSHPSLTKSSLIMASPVKLANLAQDLASINTAFGDAIKEKEE